MSNQPPYGGPPPQQPPYQGPPQQYGPPSYGQQPVSGSPYPGPQFSGPPFNGPQFNGPQFGGQQFGGPPQGGQPPGFGWGPQFPPGPGGFQQPPRKKSKAGWIVVPVVVVFAGIVGLWTLGVVAKHHKHDDYVTQPSYSPSYNPNNPPTEAPTDEPTTSVPVTTAPQPTAPRTTSTTPPPRQPTNTEMVTRSSIYSTGRQWTANCHESGARANGIAGARGYYMQVLSCLNRAWPRQVTMARDPFRAPHLIAMTGLTQTPCSGGAPSSFYCPTNDTIYMESVEDLKYYRTYLSYPNRAEALTWLRAKMTDTVAHEYGHHVQNLTGILDASWNLQYEKTGDAALQVSRRREIQATCFGNVFMGSNKSSYKIRGSFRTQLSYLHSHQGDEYGTQPDHGSRKIIPYWADRGFISRNPGTCNTFVASAALVR